MRDSIHTAGTTPLLLSTLLAALAVYSSNIFSGLLQPELYTTTKNSKHRTTGQSQTKFFIRTRQ